MIIKDCVVTKSDVQISDADYVDTDPDCVMTVINPPHLIVPVYSLSTGTVVFIGNEDTSLTILIQYSADHMLMYKQLGRVDVHVGELIAAGQQIGYAVRDSVIFAHGVSKKITTAPRTIRIAGLTYYKIDPRPVLTRGVVFSSFDARNVTIVHAADELIDPVFIGDPWIEFNDNRQVRSDGT